jgi:uncharacterized protein (TIGR00290 family)
MIKDKVAVSWSGGKDSTMALYYITKQKKYEVAYLLTTITEGFERVTMHGVRRELIKEQAESLGYPLLEVFIPPYARNEVYEERMKNATLKLISEGITKYVFGDIYLEDVRRYREKNLKKLNLEGIWPIWGRDTKELALEFIKLGFKAIVCVVDTNVLDKSFVGREFNEKFISELPSNVDPCGEKGEFHTFVYDGPLFKKEVKFKLGEKVLRENRFYFIDLIPLA